MRIQKILLIILFLVGVCFASESSLQKNSSTSAVSTKYFDINRINTPIYNNGYWARHLVTGNTNFYFDDWPILYVSGLWLGATVNGEIRASVAEYYTDFSGGILDESGNIVIAPDSVFRVYKINRGDNAENNVDYAQWPAQWGAPTDEQGNPLLLGDQTLWCSFIDADTSKRDVNSVPPLGAEVHLTVWGWQEIDNVIFLHYEIFNKSGTNWDSLYVGLFMDPDISPWARDFTGSDSTLNFVYAYETFEDDFLRDNYALGSVMLASPIVESVGDTAITFWGERLDFRNIDVLAPKYRKSTSGGWQDVAPYQTETIAHEIYNRLQCISTLGELLINPLTGERTTWAYTGDPVKGVGWLDPRPRDRRMMLSAGPLNVAPGDSLDFTLALFPNVRHDRLMGVYDLQRQAVAMQAFFRNKVGLYTQAAVANFGEQNFPVSLRMINSENVRQLEFTVQSFSADLTMTDFHPAGRAADFATEITVDTVNNQMYVKMTAISDAIFLGNGVIGEIGFSASEMPQNLLADFIITEIQVLTENDEMIFLSPIEGLVKLEQLPAPPQLLTPADGELINGMKIDFSWTYSAGSDTNIYLLKLGDDVFQDVSDDTLMSFPVSEFVFEENYSTSRQWTVEISNYGQKICSPDTFSFHLPQPDELQFTEKIGAISPPFDASRMEVFSNYFYHNGKIYFFADEWDWHSQADVRLFLYQTTKNMPYLLKTQSIENCKEVSLFARSDTLAFIFQNNELLIYDVDENFQFHYLRNYHFSHLPLAMKTFRNYLFLIHGYYNDKYHLLVYKISPNGTIVQVQDYPLTDWKKWDLSSPENGIMTIRWTYLILAFGDWGMFDISNPEAIRLICHQTLPAGLATTVALDAAHGQIFLGSSENEIFIYDFPHDSSATLIYRESFGTTRRYGKVSPMTQMKVYGSQIYFNHLYNGNFQTCHRQPGQPFIINGILAADNPILTKNMIFDWSRSQLYVYRNLLTTEVESNNHKVPSNFILLQNYPNPFNSLTKIRFYLPQRSEVSLVIYNLLGQKVKTLIKGMRGPGSFSVFWNGKNDRGEQVPSGMYFARLKAEKKTRVIKLLLIE